MLRPVDAEHHALARLAVDGQRHDAIEACADAFERALRAQVGGADMEPADPSLARS